MNRLIFLGFVALLICCKKGETPQQNDVLFGVSTDKIKYSYSYQNTNSSILFDFSSSPARRDFIGLKKQNTSPFYTFSTIYDSGEYYFSDVVGRFKVKYYGDSSLQFFSDTVTYTDLKLVAKL